MTQLLYNRYLSFYVLLLYAAYGTFVIFQEKAVDLVGEESIPSDVRLRIIEAEDRAKPVADSLLNAYVEFLAVKAEFNAGNTSEERLVAAATSLDGWITRLAPMVNELIRTIQGAE
jgi:hypothetical protein